MATGHIFNPKDFSSSGGRSVAFKSASLLSLFFAVYCTVSLFAEVIVSYVDAAQLETDAVNATAAACPPAEVKKEYGNALYVPNEDFRLRRRPELLGLTRREADFGRRLLASVVLGALIGVERRAPNRPAGVRTMSLVSLGACLFTICSAYAFEQGSQEWDASRISAALPSGVGFIGGAVIFKQGGEVIGLTTATGIWTSCAVGVACGGSMYFVALLGCSGMVTLLRFGPRSPDGEQEDDDDEQPELPCFDSEKVRTPEPFSRGQSLDAAAVSPLEVGLLPVSSPSTSNLLSASARKIEGGGVSTRRFTMRVDG